jgi:hypothetical protein
MKRFLLLAVIPWLSGCEDLGRGYGIIPKPKESLAAFADVPARSPSSQGRGETLSSESCLSEVVCDVRVFDPNAEDSRGKAQSKTKGSGGAKVVMQIFRHNTAWLLHEATDPKQHTRTEVACFLPATGLRVENIGTETDPTIDKAVDSVRSQCLAKASR